MMSPHVAHSLSFACGHGIGLYSIRWRHICEYLRSPLNVVDTLDGGGESQLVKWSVVLFGQGPKGGGGGGGGGLAWWVWGLVGVGSFAVLAGYLAAVLGCATVWDEADITLRFW